MKLNNRQDYESDESRSPTSPMKKKLSKITSEDVKLTGEYIKF